MNIFKEFDKILADSNIRLSKIFYHGTSNKQNAKKIIKNGLIPPKIDKPRRRFAPIPGRVYLTPYISYAQIYALGANMAGTEIPETIINNEGRYGYVFEVTANDIIDNIQPDEDIIGEMLYHKINGTSFNMVENKSIEPENIPDWLMYLARNKLTSNQFNKVKEYFDYADLAAAGKKILKYMNNKHKLEIVKMGVHVSYKGNITPINMWKIDKKRSNELNENGSNFFDIAEQVNLH